MGIEFFVTPIDNLACVQLLRLLQVVAEVYFTVVALAQESVREQGVIPDPLDLGRAASF